MYRFVVKFQIFSKRGIAPFLELEIDTFTASILHNLVLNRFRSSYDLWQKPQHQRGFGQIHGPELARAI